MRNSHNMTPKEVATSLHIDYLRQAHKDAATDFYAEDQTPAFTRAVQRHLAIMHNAALEKSGFDGTNIELDAREEAGL